MSIKAVCDDGFQSVVLFGPDSIVEDVYNHVLAVRTNRPNDNTDLSKRYATKIKLDSGEQSSQRDETAAPGKKGKAKPAAGVTFAYVLPSMMISSIFESSKAPKEIYLEGFRAVDNSVTVVKDLKVLSTKLREVDSIVQSTIASHESGIVVPVQVLESVRSQVRTSLDSVHECLSSMNRLVNGEGPVNERKRPAEVNDIRSPQTTTILTSIASAGGLPTIRIPQDRQWGKAECDNLPHYDFECPPERLVDMEVTIQEGLDIVEQGVQSNFRVDPLVIARLHRGGKTTVLKALFQRLKESNYLPIIISLSGLFYLRPSESPLQALIRLIAVQFVDVLPDETASNFVCREHDLCRYLTWLSESHKKHIVLIVDELNRLGVPLDVQVAEFLKRCFLDKVGHFLVFSSHVLLTVDADEPVASSYMTSSVIPPSNRYVRTIHLPFCSDRMRLREMGDVYSALTDLDITLEGGIPSLVYVKHQTQEKPTEEKFNTTMGFSVKYKHLYLIQRQRELIEGFLWELRDGKRAQSLFSCFADTFLIASLMHMRYPLPYVACIWEWLTDDGSLKTLIATLSLVAREVEGGKEWEVIIVAAMYLRFLFCKYVPVVNGAPNRDPLNIAMDGVGSVTVCDIPGEIHTIGDALIYLRGRFLSSQKPLAPLSVVIAVPRYNKFPDLDGLILYTYKSGQMKTHGYQAKTKREYPRHDLPETIDSCFLLRGCSPERPFRRNKWYYVEEDTLLDLLGFNLRPFYPRDWGSVATEDPFD